MHLPSNKYFLSALRALLLICSSESFPKIDYFLIAYLFPKIVFLRRTTAADLHLPPSIFISKIFRSSFKKTMPPPIPPNWGAPVDAEAWRIFRAELSGRGQRVWATGGPDGGPSRDPPNHEAWETETPSRTTAANTSQTQTPATTSKAKS